MTRRIDTELRLMLDEFQSDISDLIDEENDARDNLPDALRDGEARTSNGRRHHGARIAPRHRRRLLDRRKRVAARHAHLTVRARVPASPTRRASLGTIAKASATAHSIGSIRAVRLGP